MANDDQPRQDGCMYMYNHSNGPEKNMYRKLYAAGFVFGFTMVTAIFLFHIYLFVIRDCILHRTPSIPFQLHSLDLTSNSSSLAFSVHNPLPVSVYFHVAKASVSYEKEVVGFKLMDPFRVMMGEDKVLAMDLSPGAASFGRVDRVVGFEVRVEGLVKIHDESITEEIGLVQVVCGRLEIRFSSSVGVLVGGPWGCHSSWENFY